MPSHGEPYKVAQLGGSVAQPGQIARDDKQFPCDAEFIAAARADVPALIAEVRRLREAAIETFSKSEGEYENRKAVRCLLCHVEEWYDFDLNHAEGCPLKE